MLVALRERPGKSLPTAFQEWSNIKAAYRFFSNGYVSEDKILEGHFAASALRIQAADGPILILQNTTEFSFKRAAPEKIGFTKVSTGRKLKEALNDPSLRPGLPKFGRLGGRKYRLGPEILDQQERINDLCVNLQATSGMADEHRVKSRE